ncbi:NADPH-dependent FMN reductase [Paenibacillus sp. SAF-054]|uniref:NADPH-dependent FMN reductase n=1 Tax=unclassified Paenibacillus TaxID=185978 RepID=UPI003F7EF5A4
MLNIAIIIGSTRPGRNGAAVAEWVYELAKQREDARFEIVDIADYNLPLLDEPMGAASGQYTKPHTIAWSDKIKSFDGYVFLTPEYNHAISGALKNAIDYLYREWNNKAAAIVSYGAGGGIRASENLRLIAAELMLAVVRGQVALTFRDDFENYSELKPAPYQAGALKGMLDQLIAWSGALKTLRE